MSWGSEQPWVVAAAGPSGWETVAAALVAVGGNRVAAVVVGPTSADLVRTIATTCVQMPVASRADDVVRVATALLPSHDRVVITAPGGLLAPLGGFTLADVAWALRSPVVVAAGPGPAAASEVALTLEALENRHVTAAVVAVGPAEHLADLPVALAGRIPADAHEQDDFAAHALEWLDPLLVGEPSRPAGSSRPAESDSESDSEPASEPASESVEAGPAPVSSRRVFTGKRVAIALLILTIAALQALYMVSLFSDDPPAARSESQPLLSVEISAAHTLPADPTRGVVPRSAQCEPGQPVAVPVLPDAAIAARVDTAWTRIEAVLAARAPAAARSLRPGATPDALRRTQAIMSVAYPADLAASLLRHDGTMPAAGFEFPPFHRYGGLNEIYAQWRVTCQVAARGGWGSDWFHAQFIPFAFAGDGGSLVLDGRPGMNGRVGEYYPESGTRFDNQPKSLTELLEAVASSLETGTPYAGRYRPTFTADGALDWAF